MATIRNVRGRWQAIIRRKGYPAQSKVFDLKKDAEKWARRLEALLDSGRWVDLSEVKQTTLGEMLERYATEVSTTKRGRDVEIYRINCLKRSTLAQYSVAAVTAQLMAQWRDKRLSEVSGSTVCREMNLLGHVFTIAIREWAFALHSNPVGLIRKPPPGKPRDRVLNDVQRAALIAACGQSGNHWVKPVVIFALETAARRGEILALKWDDVDLQRGTAKLSLTKTGNTRTVPLSPACKSMLMDLPRSSDGYVFPVNSEAIKGAYERSVLRAGIMNFTFHDLRHDALTRLAKMGFSVLELRAISGHANANMLQRYVSIDAGDLANRMATMG